MPLVRKIAADSVVTINGALIRIGKSTRLTFLSQLDFRDHQTGFSLSRDTEEKQEAEKTDA